MIRTVTAMQPNASPTAATVDDLLKEGYEGPNRMHVHICASGLDLHFFIIRYKKTMAVGRM